MQVSPGQSLLIAGASGAGKTSTLRAIAGLWSSGSGVIRRHGRPVSAGSGGSGDIFFVPQASIHRTASALHHAPACACDQAAGSQTAELPRGCIADRIQAAHIIYAALLAVLAVRSGRTSCSAACGTTCCILRGPIQGQTHKKREATVTSHRQAATRRAAKHSPVSTLPLRPWGAATEQRLQPMAAHPAHLLVHFDRQAMLAIGCAC